jgi:hypothetical protein
MRHFALMTFLGVIFILSSCKSRTALAESRQLGLDDWNWKSPAGLVANIQYEDGTRIDLRIGEKTLTWLDNDHSEKV